MFFDMWKLYIFWKFIQYTLHWDKTQMIKLFSSDKIHIRGKALFFLWRAPASHSFAFNLRFLYVLKHKNRLSKRKWDFPVLIPFHFSKA